MNSQFFLVFVMLLLVIFAPAVTPLPAIGWTVYSQPIFLLVLWTYVCVTMLSMLIAQQTGKFSSRKKYGVLVVSLQKFLAMILVLVTVQYLLSSLSAHPGTMPLLLGRGA